jgi:ElaB/YqjD/DUF883 family membrane-anchored ribosome-binding protein
MQISTNPVVQGVKRTAAEIDALLDASASRLGDAREALAARIDRAGERIRNIEVGAARKVRIAARETERYAREHPWQVAGLGLALVAALGIAVGLAAGSKGK